MNFGEEGGQCIFCSSSLNLMPTKKQSASQLKFEVRTIFVLKKLLKISSSTCSDLLKFGNPSTWISYCVECFETIIEAERVFSKLTKLENKWKNLTEIVEEKVCQLYNRSRAPRTFSDVAHANIGYLIRSEAVENLKLLKTQNNEDIESSSLTESQIKIDIDDVNEYFSEDNALNVPEEYEPSEESNILLFKLTNRTKNSPGKNYDQEEEYGDCSKTEETEIELKNKFEGRTRSGRLTKSKYASDLSDTTPSRNSATERNRQNIDCIETHNSLRPTGHSDPFSCSLCSRTFKNSEGLNYHQIRCHEGDSEKAYWCKICSKGLTLRQSFLRHMEKQHPDQHIPQFYCFHCSSDFATKSELKDHICKNAKDNEHMVCLKCEKNFPSALHLKIHNKLHHDGEEEIAEELTSTDGLFKCRKCPQSYRSFRGRRRHELISHVASETKTYGCKKCDKGYFHRKNLRTHVQVHHSRGRPASKTRRETRDVIVKSRRYACTLCDKAYFHQRNLRAHEKKHIMKSEKVKHKAVRGSLKKGFTCTEVQIEQNNDEDQEPTAESTTTYEIFKCQICHLSFNTLSGQKLHQTKVHGSSKERRHACKICDKSYYQRKNLLTHEATQHGKPVSNEAKNRCLECNLNFATLPTLQSHIREKHATDLQCHLCSKQFKCIKYKESHIANVHGKEKNYICEICSQSFVYREQLKYHQMKEHEKSDKLKCKECEHISADPGSLRKHIAVVHNKDSCAFKCPVCSYKAICKSYLDNHIMRKHTNEKPFACTLCKRSYACKSSLKIHMRSHTGEKPFACQFCRKAFHTNYKRNRHEEDLHSTVNSYQCETCGKSFPSKHYLQTHVYDTHRKRQNDLVPDKRLIDDELLKKVVSGTGTEKPNVFSLILKKSLQISE